MLHIHGIIPLLRVERLLDSFPVSHAVQVSPKYDNHVWMGSLKKKKIGGSIYFVAMTEGLWLWLSWWSGSIHQ